MTLPVMNPHQDRVKYLRFTSFLLTILFAVAIFKKNADAAEVIHTFEQIRVGYQLSVGADRLCQDGQYLYFKTKPDCHATNAAYENDKSRGEYQRFSCEESLLLTPLREVEEIFIPELPTKSILRFFSVQSTYLRKSYSKIKSKGVPDRFRLISSSVNPLPMCKGRAPLKPTNIFSVREANQAQKYLITSLLANGISVLNMPHGALNSFHPQSEPTHFSLGNFAPMAHTNSGTITARTPYCNPHLNEEDILNLLGGESSGGGYRTLATDVLQKLSTGVEIRNVLSQNGFAALLKGPFKANVRVFEVNCLPTLATTAAVK